MIWCRIRWVRALRSERLFHGGEIRNWLFTILINLNRNRLRTLSRRPQHAPLEDADVSDLAGPASRICAAHVDKAAVAAQPFSSKAACGQPPQAAPSPELAPTRPRRIVRADMQFAYCGAVRTGTWRNAERYSCEGLSTAA